jgi:pyruvate dehydrogenase (quinone)
LPVTRGGRLRFLKTDPEVVPLPPHLTLKEARGFIWSVLKGDVGSRHVIAETAAQVFNAIAGKKE